MPDGAPPVSAERDPGLPCRGWADLLAAHLAERVRAADPSAPAASGGASAAAGDADPARPGANAPDPARPGASAPFRYANLAVRGRLLRPILRDQLPAALELRPDLVSLIGGGNDLLRPLADPDALAADLERGVARLREAGVDVLLGTRMNSADSPVIRRSRGRVAVLNSHVWSIARRYDAYVLDVWGMRSLRDWRMWAPDRIHLATEGHRRVAQGALVALGLAPDDAAWDDPLVPLPPLPPAARVRSDAEWLRVHVYPWATRRLRGRSSGDLRQPKRPELLPVEG